MNNNQPSPCRIMRGFPHNLIQLPGGEKPEPDPGDISNVFSAIHGELTVFKSTPDSSEACNPIRISGQCVEICLCAMLYI